MAASFGHARCRVDVDVRSAVDEAVFVGVAGRRSLVGDAVEETGDVLREAAGDGPVALPVGSQTRPSRGLNALAFATSCPLLFLPSFRSQRTPRFAVRRSRQPPVVVDEQRMRAEIGALAVDEDRVPLDLARSAPERRNHVGALDDGRSVQDPVVAPRLVVVGEAHVVEQVVPEVQRVRSRSAGRQEVGALDEDVLVVALLVRADAAERGGRCSAGRPDRRAACPCWRSVNVEPLPANVRFRCE